MKDSDSGQPMFPDAAFDEALLDLHLGRLSAEERDHVLRRIHAEPTLASQHAALSGVFSALGLLREIVPAASDLESRISARVAAAGSPLRVSRSAESRKPNVAWENDRVIRLHSIRDVMAVAAMIVLAIGVGVPGLLHMRERGQRTLCASNLAQIGRGLQSYGNTFGDNLPFAGWSAASSWRPTGEPGVALVPNRKHLFPLVRTQFVPTTALVCPSAKDIAMPADQVRLRDDFLESRNVSYANQNMAGVRPSLRSDANLVVLADDNPLFSDGQPLLNLAAQKLGITDAQQSNSRAHGGVGQNILRLDGHTEWTTSPNCGVNNDNIWTLMHIAEYTGREGPMTSTDSHLLK